MINPNLIFGTSICSAVVSIGLLIRNEQVFKYRMKLLKQVSDKAKLDITKNNFDWAWRYEYLINVSYIKMVLIFWRRLDSFYPDKKFLE